MSMCLAIVANLCLNTSASVEIVDNAIWSGATIRSEEFIIESRIRSDMQILGDRAKLAKICSGEKCIYFSSKCSTQGQVYKCRAIYTSDLENYLKEINFSFEVASGDVMVAPNVDLVVNDIAVPLGVFAGRQLGMFPPFLRDR